jgi:hypothetical protein
MKGLEKKEEDPMENQVTNLVEAIQQLQQRIIYLELKTVWDQREATDQSAVERINTFAKECKQLSDRSAQTYEKLTKDPKLKTLESQL